MKVLTNRNDGRRSLILVLATLVALVGFQPGLAGNPDIEQLRQGAKQGNAEAQYALGRAYGEGQGVAEDDREAVKWYRKAAKQGHPEAQYGLGAAFGFGRGVRKNYRKARKWWLKAAEQGNADAQNALGVMYHTVMGVRYNLQEALKWYRMAAEQGHVDAQINLGHTYATSTGGEVGKDDREALKWYRMAAEQGHNRSQYFLGKIYASGGVGVAKDYVKSYAWATVAAGSYGGEKAERKAEMDQLGSRMTSEQMAEAQQLAAEISKRIKSATTQ